MADILNGPGNPENQDPEDQEYRLLNQITKTGLTADYLNNTSGLSPLINLIQRDYGKPQQAEHEETLREVLKEFPTYEEYLEIRPEKRSFLTEESQALILTLNDLAEQIRAMASTSLTPTDIDQLKELFAQVSDVVRGE